MFDSFSLIYCNLCWHVNAEIHCPGKVKGCGGPEFKFLLTVLYHFKISQLFKSWVQHLEKWVHSISSWSCHKDEAQMAQLPETWLVLSDVGLRCQYPQPQPNLLSSYVALRLTTERQGSVTASDNIIVMICGLINHKLIHNHLDFKTGPWSILIIYQTLVLFPYSAWVPTASVQKCSTDGCWKHRLNYF